MVDDDLFVVQVDGETTPIRVVARGELDLSNTKDLLDAAHRAIDLAAQDCRAVDVDVAAVSFCDSAGVRTLVRARDDATARRVALRYVAVHPSVRYVADVLGLAELFEHTNQ
jgi:stage II sporulation protein AA (anti-sigma F factor antagonist)